MKESIKIQDMEKWQAVVSCDSKYDGMFFYGVKTTGIFCRPSCKSKTPIRANVIFFDNVANAIEAGFRPCKRCCPDKIVFEPDLELVKKAKDIFDVGYNKTIKLNDPNEFQKMTSEELGRVTFTSKSTVIRLCKKLNVSSYQELKKVLYSELNEERILGKEDACPTLNKKSTNREIESLLQQVYKKTIDEVNLLNNQIIINRIMNQIIKMEKIEFYSTGIGYSVLETVSHKFNSIGIESNVSSTLNERYLASAKKKFKIMAFVLSFSGNNPFVIHAAEVLRHFGIYVVGSLNDDISKYCDELINIPTNSPEGMDILSTQHSINYIFDMMFTKMLANQY